MIYSIDDIYYNVVWNPENSKEKTPLIFFHGFTGSVNDWQFLEDKLPQYFSPIFIDLLGHGNSSAPEDLEKYSSDNQIEQINKLFKKLELKNPILVGYSMGGRLALSYAMKYQNEIKALVLESTSFGIENIEERQARVKTDEELSQKILNYSLEDFINYWMAIPLFDSQKKLSKERNNQVYRMKLESNNKVGLQNSLLGFSTGEMGNYYSQLTNLNLQTMLIVGELDTKYCKISKKVNNELCHSQLEIIKDCGHNVHLEKPEEFLKFLNQFLLNIRDDK